MLGLVRALRLDKAFLVAIEALTIVLVHSLPAIANKDLGPCHPASTKFVCVELGTYSGYNGDLPPISGRATIALMVGQCDDNHRK
jgi:hypothetical protein